MNDFSKHNPVLDTAGHRILKCTCGVRLSGMSQNSDDAFAQHLAIVALQAKSPCDNEDCDVCNPLPHYQVSTHRIQHIVYKREIKASSPEEALRLFNEPTAHPSSYDDYYGEVLQEDPVVVELLPEDKWDHDCWHYLDVDLEIAKQKAGVTKASE